MFQFNLSRFVHFLRNSRSKVDSHSELQKGFAVFRQIPANPVVHLSLWAQRKSLYYLGQTVAFIFIFCFSMSATCCQAPLCLEKKIKAPNAPFFFNHWRCIYNFWLLRLTLPCELFAMIRHENIRILWPYFREQGVFLLETRPTRISNVN